MMNYMNDELSCLENNYKQLNLGTKEIPHDINVLRNDYLFMRKYIKELEDNMEMQDQLLSLIPRTEYDKAVNNLFPRQK